jgi:hypothetical protein
VSGDHFHYDAYEPPASAGWDVLRAPHAPGDCFADEIAIDFPSVRPVVDRMRASLLGDEALEEPQHLAAELRLSTREAREGLVIPLEVPIRGTCPCCGGRGETWTEPCGRCYGTGASVFHHAVRVAVPAGVADGARFRFRISSPDAAPVRVELRVAIQSAA